MHDIWVDRFSDYIDDGLTPAERDEVDAHLRSCAACRDVLADLHAVRAQAHDTPPPFPARDLWPGIATQLNRSSSRRVSMSWPMAIAASFFIAVVSGLATWVVVMRPEAPAGRAIDARTTADAFGSTTVPVSLEAGSYDRAVAELLEALDSRRAALSPATIAVLERNLEAIDRALREARAALARDPNDVALAAYVADRQRVKLAVLRQVERLAPVAP